MYTIYIHTNKINQKKYIGITKRNPIYRWGKDGAGYIQQPKFHRAIIKYGWENFSHEIVDYAETLEEAIEKEAILIEKYDSINNGYNVLPKGIGSLITNNKPVICLTTNTVYSSVTEAAKKNNVSSAWLIIQNCKGENGGTKGLDWAYWDEINKKPIDKKEFKRKIPSNATPVYCIELDKTFPSVAAAERELGITENGVEKAINGHRNGANGLHFIKESEKTEEKIKQVLKQRTGKYRKIYCEETQQIFNSLQEAADFCKRSTQSVRLNCQGKRQSCGGYHFKFYEDII